MTVHADAPDRAAVARDGGLALVRRIEESVIGDDVALPSPYGMRRITYADHTASGRALSFLEDYIGSDVLPWYANTHTESSGTGRYTTVLREQAREIIRAAVGGRDEHVVIFTGSGSTGAIDKFMRILQASGPWGERHGTDADRPIVFVGPHEHHSNELLWRESAAEVVRVPEDEAGRIDARFLDRALAHYTDRRLRIGCFSAASNVTGTVADVTGLSRLLHRHGALACWDYASAGPHLRIDVAGRDGLDHQDAVFLSPHKFPGGPGTPGVLVIRRDLVRNRVPTVPGGGTISYVHATGQHYLSDPVHREEGGTPAIVESVRAGLVFQLKEAVGVETIRERERRFVRRAITSWRANPAIEILGDPDADRLPILSFVVHRPGGLRLHHNLVVALLNDVFGIQCRGGCSCAGPYGHRLLGIGPDRAHAFASEAVDGWLGIKPGWTRVSFSFYMSEEVVDYIIAAVNLTAAYGAGLLPWYRFDPRSGLWRHHLAPAPPAGLAELGYDSRGELRRPPPPARVASTVLAAYLEEGRRILTGHSAREPGPRAAAGTDGTALPPRLERLRWFETVSEPT